jgi:hypothetical protein
LVKILTIDNLGAGGGGGGGGGGGVGVLGFLTLVKSCLCKKSEETVNHLLIHYEFTCEIWHLILILFVASWVMAGNILSYFNAGRRRVETIHIGHLESHPYFMYVEHLEKEIDVFSRTVSLMCCN